MGAFLELLGQALVAIAPGIGQFFGLSSLAKRQREQSDRGEYDDEQFIQQEQPDEPQLDKWS